MWVGRHGVPHALGNERPGKGFKLVEASKERKGEEERQRRRRGRRRKEVSGRGPRRGNQGAPARWPVVASLWPHGERRPGSGVGGPRGRGGEEARGGDGGAKEED